MHRSPLTDPWKITMLGNPHPVVAQHCLVTKIDLLFQVIGWNLPP
jgi:hypothetical protein